MSDIRAACRHGLAVLVTLAFGLAAAAPARAQIGSDRYASIMVEAQSGSVLLATSPDELRHPASLTKMMTLYMAFEALRDGRLTLSTPLLVSAEAAEMPPSRLGLQPGMTISVEEAILALVTKSANDAAAALGERLGGSEARFAQMMTLRARTLGMNRTVFRNASGLPDDEQVSTARDMAVLARRLLSDFPERYGYFSVASFSWRGRTIFNHNRLLQEYEGADGLKTGFVNDSGFNLVASAARDGVRLIGVVFGGATGRERDRHMMALLDQGFDRMGVAPRAPVPSIMAAAQAGTLPRGLRYGRGAAAPRFMARAEARPVPAAAEEAAPSHLAARNARQAAARGRQAGRLARIEQGDTDRPTGGRAASRPETRTVQARLAPQGRLARRELAEAPEPRSAPAARRGAPAPAPAAVPVRATVAPRGAVLRPVAATPAPVVRPARGRTNG
ncbi:D-alanyl-D-alanine carboxypeptidase [Roseomonas sp. NAR14]|uniref:D-alanyl-D-alanine carboxypeptidase n=1 Tax=Roseomonas acroporae TaxID=2937791 RepID=A0A9X1Y8M3_9PROT|nr:D-alanyl-D-alanine carboxypeptidase family protein [Roseomonas acroporae]MCK8785095.1 D-alanyl-D-alanine carboxypeptidase [Roseomonas acroporae]